MPATFPRRSKAPSTPNSSGTFASYGYCKDPQNHNRLIIDPPAAEVVRRIFYRADYDAQEQALQAQLDKLRSTAQDSPLSMPWVKELLALGHLTELDPPTVAAAIREIRVYERNRMEIDYLFLESYRALLER